MSRSLSILAFSLIAVLMSNCAGTIALHDFSYHGTDAVLANHSFFYVQQAAVGKATTEYDLRRGSGGFVRDGLVADAKNNLAEQSPLGPNQTYANMAIDVITENIGYWWGGTHFVKRIRLTAVVSADIIEFGEPSAFSIRGNETSMPLGSQGQIPSIEEEEVKSSSLPSPAAPLNSGSVEVENSLELKVDDFVWVKYKSGVYYGYVLAIRGEQVLVQFTQDGVSRERRFALSEVYATKEEAEAN